MASSFTHVIQNDMTAQPVLVPAKWGRVRGQDSPGAFVISDLLSCLLLSRSEQRAQMLQSVAKEESWQAKVCDDVQEFLLSVFQLDVPLIIVDLPSRTAASYAELREMTAQACGLNRSLFVVCGAADGDVEDSSEEELWARQLGAWAYLPDATDRGGLRLVFAEARKAFAKQSAAYVDTSGFW